MSRSRNASNLLCLTRNSRVDLAVLLSGFALLALSGCGREPVAFATNSVFAAKLEQELGQPLDEAQQDVEAILVDAFGTPDEPRLPAVIADDPALSGLMDLARLKQAAGAVSSDHEGEHVGLYREHCSACHGVSGDGLGPAALFQNPYPRDYRDGVFKYKSTPRGAKPTRQDLARTIRHGLPGTAMPAFELLAAIGNDAQEGSEADIEALLDYVIYLSIRGELERRLLVAAATEFDYTSDSGNADRLLGPDPNSANEGSAEGEDYAAQTQWIAAELREIAGRWASAEAEVPVIPDPPPLIQAVLRNGAPGDTVAPALAAAGVDQIELQESILIGRELFHGQIANCSSCHGVGGAGGTVLADYDDWTKEWTTQLGLDPKDRNALEPFLDAGALPPRPLPARQLTLGTFRGGSSPEDIYLRIVHGIDGTPMPAVNLVESASGTGLTSDQVWHLVHYVLSLGDPAASDPAMGDLATAPKATAAPEATAAPKASAQEASTQAGAVQ